MTYLIVAAIGVALAVGAFVWVNRNKPEELDKVEEKVRAFKKK